ncbi:MAG: hypothetical protein WC558_12845 [Patulibacter sp.]
MTPRSSEPSLDAHDAAVGDDDAILADAVVDGEIVSVTTTISDVPFVDPSAHAAVEAVRPGALTVAARTAAVVTTGFVAGAITTAVVARKAGVRRRSRSLGSPVGRRQRFLVDVQLLGDR